MGKIGRNDKCPCGSGKKYKNCCMDKSNIIKPDFKNLRATPIVSSGLDKMKAMVMEEMGYSSAEKFEIDFKRYTDFMESDEGQNSEMSFREFMGEKSNTAEFNRELKRALEKEGLMSDDETQKFIKKFTSEYNLKPKKKFLGLSSKQLALLLEDCEGFTELDKKLNSIVNFKKGSFKSDLSNIEVVKIFKFIIDEFSEDKEGFIKITRTGEFSVSFINKIRKELFNETHKNIKSNKLHEYDIWKVEVVHKLLYYYNFVEHKKGFCFLKEDFCSLLEGAKNDYDESLWYLVFDFVFFKLKWSELFYYQDVFQDTLDFFGKIKMFSFYALHHLDVKLKGGWIRPLDFFELIKEAFPEFVDNEKIPKAASAFLFVTNFLENICFGLGLIESDYESFSFWDNPEMSFRCTDLFRELFKWKV